MPSLKPRGQYKQVKRETKILQGQATDANLALERYSRSFCVNLGAAVAVFDQWKKNLSGARGLGGEGSQGRVSGCSGGGAGPCSPGFYCRPIGSQNVFCATGRMFSQTELLVRQDEGRNAQRGQWWFLFAFQQPLPFWRVTCIFDLLIWRVAERPISPSFHFRKCGNFLSL